MALSLFLGGLHPNPQRINVYANIHNNGIIDIQINKKKIKSLLN
jgi:hypothetical protein